ncbi:MAG: AAA family ATPase [Beijerinckiaceae bacterium]|nr:AAA family ATPase [Beijerinckiaceae bacterium]
MKDGEGRNGKFIAVANMKGGVGKTTTVVSLAEALSANDESAKVLVIDLDPQASASVAIASDPILAQLIEQDRTFEAFLEERLIKDNKKINILDLVHRRVSGTWHQGRQLDMGLLPCGPHLRVVEKELIYELANTNHSITSIDGLITKLFQRDIIPLGSIYDFILFDCAPGISPVTEIAIRLSDLVIIPTIPDYLSVYGLNAFYDSIWKFKAKGLPSPKNPPSVLVTRMQRNVRQHREVLEGLQQGAAALNSPYRLFLSQIPTSAALVEAIMKDDGLTFTQKYTKEVISSILIPLVKEVIGAIG